jgi:hypothetical protein
MKFVVVLRFVRFCLVLLMLLAPAARLCAEPAQPATPANSALELQAAAQLLHRTLSYRHAEPVSGVQPFAHRVPIAPALSLDLTLYPFAFRATHIWSHLGLRASYQQLLATETELFAGTPDAQRVDTSMWKLELGLRGRIPIAQHALGLSLLAARHSFGIADVVVRGERGAVVPSVRYDALKLALDARLQFGGVSIGAELGTRFVGHTGDLEQRWQRVDKTRVLELSATLAYRVQRCLDVYLGFGMLRYAITMQPALERDALDARQVVDLELSGSLGLRFVL